MTVEKEWLEGKHQSLDLSDKKELLESELNYIYEDIPIYGALKVN